MTMKCRLTLLLNLSCASLKMSLKFKYLPKNNKKVLTFLTDKGKMFITAVICPFSVV